MQRIVTKITLLVTVGSLATWIWLRQDVPMLGSDDPRLHAPPVPAGLSQSGWEGRVESAPPAASAEKANADAKARSFDEVYADIVACLSAQANAAANPNGERDGGGFPPEAGRLNALMEEMITRVPDSGGSAVHKVASLRFAWATPEAAIDVFACRAIVDLQLQARTKNAAALGAPAKLVGNLLDHMAFTVDLAQFAHGLLNRKPYLGREHEPILRAMLQAAVGEQAYLGPLARDLLLTIYLNMDADNGDLLALAQGGDGTEAQTAALHRLLLSQQYRDFAIAQLVASRDASRMNQAALFAVENLDAKQALQIVIALKSTPEGANRPFGAYFRLAERSPEELAQSYEAALSSNTLPAHRMNALWHLGNIEGARGRELATLGFHSDPSPRVRGVALLAIASRLTSAEFAPLFDQAIGDKALLAAEFGWDDIVTSVGNHARRKGGADVNFLDRATRMLLGGLPANRADLQGEVTALRREYVPQ
jgi:hypothetical protein